MSIFTFEVDATGMISETGTSISSMMPYINKWSHQMDADRDESHGHGIHFYCTAE